jgi:nucleoside-diphosphate-sugar epimerase
MRAQSRVILEEASVEVAFAMITILGAGGTIGNELARILTAEGRRFRLVGRNPKPLAGAETFPADLSDRDQTIRAVAGSTVVHLLVGLKYDRKIWQELWPRIMANAIEACKRAQAKLIFFDNIYMYGRVAGPMTETTPYNPCSTKGEIRAKIATTLMDAVNAGDLSAIIARSADFYGPSTEHGVANVLVFDNFAKGAKASWLVNADVPHSLTFTPDAARSVALLAERDSAWDQIWHLPTAQNPPTGREFIEIAAKEFGVPPKFRLLNRPMLRLVGLVNSDVRDMYEMLYQNDSPYLFDSTKFANAFAFEATSYPEGIRRSAESYRRKT